MRPRLGVWTSLLLLASWPARAQAPAQPPPSELELGLVPLLGGDTDVGFGGGFLGSLARVSPNVRPFDWRLEGAAFFTFKVRDGKVDAPYQDAFFMLTLPRLWGGRLRLELRPSFTRETNQRYYGLGNAAVAPEEDVPARDFFTRTHPALNARARFALRGPLSLLGGIIYSHHWVSYDPRSNLARDLAQGSAPVKELLRVDRNHGLLFLETGIIYDSRDDEIAASAGGFHQLKIRVSPAVGDLLPFGYAQFNATLRGHVTAIPNRLVLAARLVGDVQVGDPPFFELPRYEEASAIGGANGVRGVPSDRYYGKVKLFGNLEARTRLVDFSVLGSPYRLGATGFFDGGRLWSELGGEPSLDGDGPGLKYGVGFGVRLQKGRTFVLRADLAWSPDARPIAGYFLGGHIF